MRYMIALAVALAVIPMASFAAPSFTVVVVGQGSTCDSAKAAGISTYNSSDASYTSYQSDARVFSTKAAATAWCATQGYAAQEPTFPDVTTDDARWQTLGSDTPIDETPNCGVSPDGPTRTTQEIFGVCYDPAA